MSSRAWPDAEADYRDWLATEYQPVNPEDAALLADFLAESDALADRFEAGPDPRTIDVGAEVF